MARFTVEELIEELQNVLEEDGNMPVSLEISTQAGMVSSDNFAIDSTEQSCVLGGI